MKSYITKYILMAFAGITFLSACGDEFLDEEIYGRSPLEEFYSTDEDAFLALIAVYDVLQYNFSNGWASHILVKTLPSDESNAGGSGNSDQPAYQTLDDFNFDSQNGALLGVWRMHYYGVDRASKVINYVQPDNEFRNQIIAEAKALRAYNYFELVSMFGDVPLVLQELDPSQFTTVGRTDAAVVYDQIEKDLREAIPLLPLKSEQADGEKFRMSKGAAQALLGKAYLYQEQWDSAAYFFEDVIASGQYSLPEDYGYTFSEEGEYGPESIFEVEFTDEVNYDWGNFPWGNPRTMESNIHIQLMGPRADFYQSAPSDSLLGGWGFNPARMEMYNAYVEAGDTERKVQNVISVEELKELGGDWTNPEAHDFDGVIRRKYGTYVTETNNQGGAVAELNYTTNWRLIRYADVLLMAAEAHYENGNEGRAQELVNMVRTRAGLDEIFPSGQDLFDAIVNERHLELAFEGFRYLDLVRWGLASEELGDLGYVEGKHNLFPIPDTDVRTAGLTQNDNY